MNAPKSVEYREAVARIIDPDAFVDIGALVVRAYASIRGEDLHERAERLGRRAFDKASPRRELALAKADAILALSGPVSGMDTSSVAEVPCSQGGSHTGGLTPLEKELVEALTTITNVSDWYGEMRFAEDTDADFLLRVMAAARRIARSALAKAEATATEAQHAGQWVLVPREPSEEMVLQGLIGLVTEISRTHPRPGFTPEQLASIKATGACELTDQEAADRYMALGATMRCGTEVVEAYRAMIAAASPPPAAPPSPAPPSSEREVCRAGDLDAEGKAP